LHHYGTVVCSTPGHYRVRADGGGDYWCALRPELRRTAERDRIHGVDSVVVGDRVSFTVLGAPPGGGAPGAGRIEGVEARRSRIGRRREDGRDRSRARPREQVLVANADLLVVVVAAASPRLKPGVIDRLCLLGRSGGVEPLICVNKVDLADPARLDRELLPFRQAGYAVHLVSAATGAGLQALAAALRGRLSALVGPSGVGKTSLANRLVPDLAAQTGAVNVKTGKGRHTTSASLLYELPGGGWLADTPGLRAIGSVSDPAGPGLGGHFPELEALAYGCRFRDCSHTHEPGCAVKAALEEGQLDPQVYRRYVRLGK